MLFGAALCVVALLRAIVPAALIMLLVGLVFASRLRTLAPLARAAYARKGIIPQADGTAA